jgi:C-terminal processing protease CtpA/Prc
LNYIRFFHPSDEAAQADWNRLASEGVRAVEGATTAPDLAKRLHRFFAPYAPSAQFLGKGQKPTTLGIPTDATFAVRWNHTGFGQANPRSSYKSMREFVPMAERAAGGWADPRGTALLRLTDGVNLCVPSVLFANASKGTLPKAAAPPSTPEDSGLPQPTAGGFGSGEDRATRLGDVVLAWGIFQHFYPYFEVVKTDWDAELPKALRAAATDKGSEAFLHTLRRMVAALKDGHGSVHGTGSGGSSVPSLDLVMVDGQMLVRSTGESAKAVPAGSRILSLDGQPSPIRLVTLKTEISAAGEGWMNSRLAGEFLAGDAGATVLVRYRTASGVEGEAVLPRDTTVWELRDASRREKLIQLKPGVWYVDLDRISEKEFEEALPNLVKAKGVIFDLRGYPKMTPGFLQHLADVPLESARWNIPIVTQPDGKAWSWDTSGRWNLVPKAPRISGKVAFLTGGGAISYAESCLAIVEAYKLAEIVGEPTAGTNGNVNPFTLPGGYSVFWTGMKVLKHDGTTHHGVGIQPTVLVRPTQQGLAEGRDEVLEKGIAVVSR